MTPKLFSVGLPVFQGEKYIKEAICSVLAQDYPHWELIISDNCSTDLTPSISQFFAEKDFRIKLIHQNHPISGHENFKFVLDKATGCFFTWLAHDDYLEADYMSQCIEKFQLSSKISCVSSSFLIIDESKDRHYTEILNSLSPDIPWNQRAINFYKYPIDNSYLAIYGSFRTEVAREVFSKTPKFKLVWATEIPFLARIANTGEIIATTSPSRIYRRHAMSTYHREQELISQYQNWKIYYLRFSHILLIRIDALSVLMRNKNFNSWIKFLMISKILKLEILEQSVAFLRNLRSLMFNLLEVLIQA